jgi:hypothetical protein
LEVCRSRRSWRTSQTAIAEKIERNPRLDALPVREVPLDDLLHLQEPVLGQRLEAPERLTDLLVGDPVSDVEALFFGFDEPGFLEGLQVLRGVGRRLAEPVGQHLDGSGSLLEGGQNFEAGGTRERLAQSGDLLEDGFVEIMAVGRHVASTTRSGARWGYSSTILPTMELKRRWRRQPWSAMASSRQRVAIGEQRVAPLSTSR